MTGIEAAEEEGRLQKCRENCRNDDVINHTILPFLTRAQRRIRLILSESDLSEFDTTPTNNNGEPRDSHQGDRSSSQTIAEPSDVSSMTSTSVQYPSKSSTLQQTTKNSIPTMIVIRRTNDTALYSYSGMSTDDEQSPHDSNNNDASSSSSTRTSFSNVASTFSSWVRPNYAQTSSSKVSSNTPLSTFSSWVRPDSRMVSNADCTTISLDDV